MDVRASGSEPATPYRIAATTARSVAVIADELARQQPDHAVPSVQLGGGWLVLTGPGCFVNRLLAGGIERPLTALELATVVERSTEIGVSPAVDTSEITDPRTIRLLREAGFEAAASTTTVMRWNGTRPSAAAGVVVRTIGAGELSLWQELTAHGWGHREPTARRISDMFTSAVAALDGEHLMIASSRDDGRPLGCASLSISDGMATLGGMSTLPNERRRGVHAALIAARIDLAIAAGCDLLIATATTGGDSERNLERLGFAVVSRVTTHQRSVRS